MSKIIHLLRDLFRKGQQERALQQEIDFYLETLTEQGSAAGMSEGEARRAAHLQVGSVEALKDSVRDVRTGVMMERFWQDLRYAVRGLRKRPGFTAAAVLVLGLGIGANSTVFSLINAFLLKPSAITRPDELAGLYSRHAKQPDSYRGFSYRDYVYLRDGNPVFSSLLAQTVTVVGVKEEDSTRTAFTGIVSANYFSTLGAPLLKGRPFRAEEEKPGGSPAVILTYSFWRRMGEDPQAIGKDLTINGRLFQIVGITPQNFTGTTALIGLDLFVPLGVYDLVIADELSHGKPLAAPDNDALILVGRLKPGVTPHAAETAMAVVASQLERAFPAENQNHILQVRPLPRMAIFKNPTDDRGLYIPAVLLLSLAGIVLLIASLNLANMMAAQGAARRKEMAIRLALGGSRLRVVQQLLTEGFVLAVLGGAAGLFVSSWSTKLLLGSLQHLSSFPLVYSSAPDGRVLVATLVFCLVSTIIFGLFPAVRLSKPQVWFDLKESRGQGVTGRVRRYVSGSNLLVIMQLSLSLMMLTAAGLFVQSAVRAAKIQPGFSLDHQVLAEVDARLGNYDPAQGRRIYGALLERLKRVPGVQSVAMAAAVPFGAKGLGTGISPADDASKKQKPAFARFNIVTEDYFRTLGIPLLRGRSFSAAENRTGSKSHVAVVDEMTARQLWPGKNALGRHILLEGGTNKQAEVCEVVGVVGNVRERILGGKTDPHVYIPFGQQYQANMQIHVRIVPVDPEAERRMLETVRREIHAADEHLPLLAVKTMHENLESGLDLWLVRTGARLLEAFGVVALLLAVIGLYAVHTYTVARRTREIGIRMALGASAPATLRMVLGESVRLIAVGLGLGLLLALALGRVLAGFLYEVRSFDPLVLLCASAVLAIVALGACYVPARRASRVAPLTALRYE